MMVTSRASVEVSERFRRMTPDGGGPCPGRRGRVRAVMHQSAVAALLALIVALAARDIAAAQTPDVCGPIERAVAAHPDVTVGVVFLDLTTGHRCEVAGQRSFRAASLYKLVVLAELFRQVDAGDIALSDPLVIKPAYAVDDPPALRIKESYTTTVGDAARRMIEFSDNASAYGLRLTLGFAAVDAAPRWMGLEGTVLGRSYVTTPADLAQIFSEIYRGRLVSRPASAAMLEFLLRQELNDLIPAGIDVEGVPVAHKTGTLATVMHDAGIVYAPGGTYVLAVLTEHDSYDAAAAAIRDVSRAAFAPCSVADPPVLLPEYAHLAVETRPEALPAVPGSAATPGLRQGATPGAATPAATAPGAESAVALASPPAGESSGAFRAGWARAGLLAVAVLAALTGPAVWAWRRRRLARRGGPVAPLAEPDAAPGPATPVRERAPRESRPRAETRRRPVATRRNADDGDEPSH